MRCRGAGEAVTVQGIDKELVGEIAARIRRQRPPEPYKGKGVRYQGEYVRRKAGKAGRVGTGLEAGGLMDKAKKKRLARQRRHARVRKRVHGTPERPRLSVFRSLKHMHAQIIDDTQGHTLVAASTWMQRCEA